MADPKVRQPSFWLRVGWLADAARAALLEVYAGWAPWLRALVEHADAAAVYPRPLYVLPVGHRWAHVSGATVLGDAAHLMSPFSGAGANLAMLDALELGLALVEVVAQGKGQSVADIDAAVAEWEERMWAMAGRVAQVSGDNLEAFVNENAPGSAIERFQSLMEGEEREG